jgi:hypothetical protein
MNSPLKKIVSIAHTQWRVLVILTLFFCPILFTGLFQDDNVLAVVNHRNPATVSAILSSTKGFIHDWLGNGRFSPIGAILSVTTFRVFDYNHYVGYHALQLLSISLSYLLFIGHFFQRSSQRIAAVLLACSMSPIYWHYHDPFISYNLLMPIFTLMFLGAVILFERYLDNGSKWHGLSALVLYVLMLCTYEVAYALILVFVVQILRHHPRTRRTWIHLAILIMAMVSFQVWLRRQSDEVIYQGLAINLNPMAVARTFVLQAFSSIPLSQQFGSMILKVIKHSNDVGVESALMLVFFTFLTGGSTFILLKFFKNRSREYALLLLGLILWLSPALVIAVSAKYQSELRWGIGYLPRYLSSFGLVLVIMGMMRRFITSRIGLVTIAAMTMLTFAFNVRNIRNLNRDYAAARMLYNIVGDPIFLSMQNCKNLFVIKSYMHSCDQLAAINPSVRFQEGGIPNENDHVLLIHPDNLGHEWAIFGIYSKGSVQHPYLLRNMRGGESPDENSLKDWSLTSLGGIEMNYERLVESITSETDTTQQLSSASLHEKMPIYLGKVTRTESQKLPQ